MIFRFLTFSFIVSCAGLLNTPQANAQSSNIFEQLQQGKSQQALPKAPTKPEIKEHPWSKDVLVQKFLRDYFKNKPTYLVKKRLQELANYGYLDQEPGSLSYLIGFLSEVFAQNKDKVLDWVSDLDLSQYQAGAIIRAMRHAQQQDKVQTWLATKSGWVYQSNPSFHNLTPTEAIIADELEDFEVLTGAYAASGKEIYVRRFAEALTLFPNYTPQEVGEDPEKARKSVINQGLQEIILLIMYAYPQAVDQMKNIIPSQPLRVQGELQKILNRLETYQGPTSEFQGLPQGN